MENMPNMSDLMKLAQSPAGQQLLTMLQNSNDPALENAMSQASAGNMAEAKKALSSLLSSPQAQALLKQMEGYL